MQNATCCIDGCEKPTKTRGMCGMHTERVRKYGDPHNRGAYIQGDNEARFWSKVDRHGEGGCWLWTGTVVRSGYGQFVIGGRRVQAHRYSYELLIGPIAAGLEIDHVKARGCRHRSCVNPDHLEAVEPIENIMRSDAYSAVNARKTQCIRGHSFDRVIVKPDGSIRRRCTICHRMKSAESYWRRKSA